MRCEHKERIVADRGTFQIHWCGKLNKTCVREQSLLQEMPGSHAVACDACEHFVAAPELPDDLKYLTCANRTFPTGDQISCKCSVDRTIYGCAVNGRCVKKLPIERPRDSFPDKLEGITICTECDAVRCGA